MRYWIFLLIWSITVSFLARSRVQALSLELPTQPTMSNTPSDPATLPPQQPQQPKKFTLYDMPVSNNGARCRLLIYKKKIEDVIGIAPPTLIGGLRSDEYLRRNPQGKMPLLSCCSAGSNSDLDIAESDTIARYLLSEYRDAGPSFQPDNPRSNLIARLHDMYLTTIQGGLYKPAPPFGIFGTRKDAITEFVKQLKVIDDLIIAQDNGLYLCGDEVSLADATLFPTIVFAAHMLPKFGTTALLPPKLSRWYEQVAAQDADFAKVKEEIMGGLLAWEKNNRWDPLLGAGWRDEEPATLFDKILSGDIPAAVVEQPDDKVLCFKDIHPAAPAHVLIIPKDRNGLTRLGKATAEHAEILGRLMVRTYARTHTCIIHTRAKGRRWASSPTTGANPLTTLLRARIVCFFFCHRSPLRQSRETRPWDSATALALW